MPACPREYREIALAWWRQKKLLENPGEAEGNSQRLRREVERLRRCVEALGMGVRDYTGRPYGNLNVEALAIETDAAVEEEVVFETVSPELSFGGEVIQRSRVVVHKPAPVEETGKGDAPSCSASEASAEKNETVVSEGQDEPSHFRTRLPQALLPLMAALAVFSLTNLLLSLGLCSATMGRFDRIDQSNEDMAQIISQAMEPDEPEGAEVEKDISSQQTPDNTSDHDQGPEIPASDDTRANEVSLVEYQVQTGDTLEGVCRSLGISYGQHMELICRINGISDPDKIYAGETLYLPVSK